MYFGRPIMVDPIHIAFNAAKEMVEEPRPLVRETSPSEPFPIHALGALRGPVEAIQSRTQAPIAICAQSALAAVTLAVQAHADVLLPTDATVPLSQFFLTIAESGERKSAVDNLALAAIREYEVELHSRYDADRVIHDADLEIWKAKKTAIQNELRKGRGDTSSEADLRAIGPEPEPPLLPIMLCPDPTFEGYCKLTAAGQPSIGLFSAEGGSFVGGHAMSSDHRLNTAAGLSSLWDGEPIRRIRAGDGASLLPGRRMSLHLMMQPEVARGLLGDDMLRSQGLLSRLLVASPRSAAGSRFWKEVDPDANRALDAYRARIGVLLRTRPLLRDGCRNALDPRSLPMSDQARALWIGFANQIESLLGLEGKLRPIAGLANKAPEHAARMAGVLTLWRDTAAGVNPGRQNGQRNWSGGLTVAE